MVDDATGVEGGASEDPPQGLSYVIAVGEKEIGNSRNDFLGGLGSDEKAPELLSDKSRALGLRDNDIDDVIAGERPRLAEEGLHSGVEVSLLEQKGARLRLHPVSGEGAGGFLDVLLGVVTLSQREEFHDFAGEVFVGMILPALAQIEPPDHRGITGHRLEKIGKLPKGVPAEGIVLIPHQEWIVDLLVARCEMPVPEERRLLQQRCGSVPHPVQPPDPQIDHGESVGLIEFLADGLFLLFRGGILFTLFKEKPCRRLQQVGDREEGALIIRIQEEIHRLAGPHGNQLINLIRRPAEPRPVEQMSGERAIPAFIRNGGEHHLKEHQQREKVAVKIRQCPLPYGLPHGKFKKREIMANCPTVSLSRFRTLVLHP